MKTVFDRCNLSVVAIAGLYGAAIALIPDATATPLKTGGYACAEGMAGDAAAAAAGGPVVAGDACTGSAPISDMSGVPLVAPGPVPVVPVGAPLIALGPPVPAGAPVPVGAPLPVGAPVPVGAPLPAGAPVLAGAPVGAPLPDGAPIIDMSGTHGGKGDPTGPPPAGGPVSGQPIPPGPSAATGAH